MTGIMYALFENLLVIGAAVAVGAAVGFGIRGLRKGAPAIDVPVEPVIDHSARVAELEAVVAEQETEGLRWLASHKELEAQVSAAKDEVVAASGKEALAEAATEIEVLKGRLGEIDVLTSDLDSARGRSAELERKLADALANAPVASAGGNQLEASIQRVAVLQGQLASAQDKITELETQVVAQ